jgi:hypothetical protein
MNVEPFTPTPDPAFIAIVSEQFPHKKTINHRMPDGSIQEESLTGTNFMEDRLRVYQRDQPDEFLWFFDKDRLEMWQQPYVDQVKNFLVANSLSLALVDNIWLLRCRINFLFVDAIWAERNRREHESDQTRRINFLQNHVLPFIKAIQGDWYLSHREDNVHSVTFKTNKPGVKSLQLTGHLANNMYMALQEMTYEFLEANKNHNPDLKTNRLKAGIGGIIKGSYYTLQQYGIFKPSPQNRPTSSELIILENLLDLGANTEGVISRIAPNSSTTEYLRKFFY